MSVALAAVLPVPMLTSGWRSWRAGEESFVRAASATRAMEVQWQALALQQMERGLKNHSDNRWLNQLPPLQTMESLLLQLITLGWLALTVAIASGSIYIDDLFAQHLAHKTLFAVISWLLFGLLLIGRQKYGWRGATAVKWTLSAFIALALAYFGSKFVLEVLLNKA